MKVLLVALIFLVLPPLVATAQFEEGAVVSRKVTPSDYNKLGEALKSNSEDDVVAAAAEILGRDSNDLKALNGLAVYYFSAKKYGMAKIILNRALNIHKEEPGLHNNLGAVYLAEGDLRAAISSFRAALKMKSSHTQSTTNLSSIFLDFRDYKKALSPLEDAYDRLRSDLGPGHRQAVEVSNNYAVALMGVGESKKSRKVFEKIIDAEVKDTDILFNYAILLIEVLKDKGDARKVLAKIRFLSDDSQMLKRVDQLENKLSALK